MEAAADAAKKQEPSGASRAVNRDTTKRVEAMHRLLAETQVPSSRALPKHRGCENCCSTSLHGGPRLKT